MALLVVAYPQIAVADYEWIQAIRRQYDPQYARIEPHFTLVFPVANVEQETFITHVTARTSQISSIPFTIRCAMIVKDHFSPLTHLFLAPDEGFSALVKLHDLLYTGVLADVLRLDLPFIPHITVGGNADPLICKALADAINREGKTIHGQITGLEILNRENGAILPLAHITLEK
jgi:2'-5' RNA ligase